MNAGDTVVVTLRPHHWRDLKALRLEALQREPAAFSSTYEETVIRPDGHWRDRLADPLSVLFMAYGEGRPIGMVGGRLGADDGDRTVAGVFSMYVTAEQRGKGVGGSLLHTLIDHVSADPEIVTVRLNVRVEQAAACRLYESHGFRVVGADPDGELIMERPSRQESVE